MEVIRAARRFPARTAVRAAGFGGTARALRAPAAARSRPRCARRSRIRSGAARALPASRALRRTRLPQSAAQVVASSPSFSYGAHAAAARAAPFAGARDAAAR